VAEYHELFAASVGAAAALIGLLFVAVSIAPDRVFGANADLDRQHDAQRAFVALGNVFFVSLVALMSHGTLIAIQAVAAIAFCQTALAAASTVRREGWKSWKHLGTISLATYAFEFYSAQESKAHPGSTVNFIYIVLGLYAYALGTSWGLLGAKDSAGKTQDGRKQA
jgi:hypothetical protein